MNTYNQLKDDLKKSMIEKASEKTSIIRMLISSLRNEEISKSSDLTEEEVISIIRTESKKVKDSIEQFTSAGREDLAEKEKKDLVIIESYLPSLLDEESTRKLVTDTIENVKALGMKDMGKVMGVLMSKHKAELDGGLTNKIVKEELSKI